MTSSAGDPIPAVTRQFRSGNLLREVNTPPTLAPLSRMITSLAWPAVSRWETIDVAAIRRMPRAPAIQLWRPSRSGECSGRSSAQRRWLGFCRCENQVLGILPTAVRGGATPSLR